MTDREEISAVKDDIIDIKIRLGVAESDIQAMKNKLDKIDHNTGKIFWTLLGSVALAIMNGIINGGIHL